jgi:formylglycine-generating enzyme required for sulfatase activity
MFFHRFLLLAFVALLLAHAGAEADLPDAAQQNAWETAQQQNSSRSYEAYCRQYPDGRFAVEAKLRQEKRRQEEALILKKMQATYGKTWVMMPYEVTFDDWKVCRKHQGCNGARLDDAGLGRGKQPAINVSYEDANIYAQWLSKYTGKHYRLPTEEEWEYAARGGTTTDYWWGNEIGNNNANCNGCGSKWDGKKPAPVGSFKPNPYGLYDTVGNVWEWTSTCVNACATRVLRGGSWGYKPEYARVFIRSWDITSLRNSNVGFRLVQDLQQK